MRKLIYLFAILFLAGVLFSCNNNEIEPPIEPEPEPSALTKAEVVFDKTFPGIEDGPFRIRINSNDDFFLLGMENVVKIDKNGNKKWAIAQRIVLDFAPTRDGGVIIASVRNSRFHLAKISSEGTIEWEKPVVGNRRLSTIVVGDDGYIYGVGAVEVPHDRNNAQPMFFKFTKEGDYLFSRFLTDTNNNNVNNPICMIKLSNNNFVVGTMRNIGITRENFDFNIIEFDTNADNISQRNYGGTQNEYLSDVIETPNGGLVLTGVTMSRDRDIQSWREGISFDYSGSAWVVKLGQNREIEWEKIMGGTGFTFFGKASYHNNRLYVTFATSVEDVDFNVPGNSKSGYIIFDNFGNVLDIRYITDADFSSSVFDSQGNLILASAIQGYDDYHHTTTLRLIKIR